MNDRRPRAGALVCAEAIGDSGRSTTVAGAAELPRQRGIPTALVNRHDQHHRTAGSARARRRLRALAELVWAPRPADPIDPSDGDAVEVAG
ncbi:MAG: hypothetical protein HKP61_12260 [Dactylosporangium sp.]|nr:hypothetical protein [Dactylosporangium sp.]NNJ61694.1 hypothetical protein [Dactylosporangium sp.]